MCIFQRSLPRATRPSRARTAPHNRQDGRGPVQFTIGDHRVARKQKHARTHPPTRTTMADCSAIPHLTFRTQSCCRSLANPGNNLATTSASVSPPMSSLLCPVLLSFRTTAMTAFTESIRASVSTTYQTRRSTDDLLIPGGFDVVRSNRAGARVIEAVDNTTTTTIRIVPCARLRRSIRTPRPWQASHPCPLRSSQAPGHGWQTLSRVNREAKRQRSSTSLEL